MSVSLSTCWRDLRVKELTQLRSTSVERKALDKIPISGQRFERPSISVRTSSETDGREGNTNRTSESCY